MLMLSEEKIMLWINMWNTVRKAISVKNNWKIFKHFHELQKIHFTEISQERRLHKWTTLLFCLFMCLQKVASFRILPKFEPRSLQPSLAISADTAFHRLFQIAKTQWCSLGFCTHLSFICQTLKSFLKARINIFLKTLSSDKPVWSNLDHVFYMKEDCPNQL